MRLTITLRRNKKALKALKKNSVVKTINIQQALFFSFSKQPGLKKKIIYVNYLIIAPIKMRVLFSWFSLLFTVIKFVNEKLKKKKNSEILDEKKRGKQWKKIN